MVRQPTDPHRGRAAFFGVRNWGFAREMSEFGLTGFQREVDQSSVRRRVVFRPASAA
jgi:hypothetical protein